MEDSVELQPQTRIQHSTRFWFAFFFATSLVCVALLAFWAATDASFRYAVWKAKIAIRLESILSTDPETLESLESMGLLDSMRTVEWDAIGKRVIGIWILCGVGLLATLITCYQTLHKATCKRGTACAIVLLTWLGLYGTQTAIDDWRSRRQVSALLPRIEPIGNSLHREWPTESGELLPGVKFYVIPDDYPDLLTLRGPRESYPFSENFGPLITRGRKGIIRFDLVAAYDSTVEYHPEGTSPEQYTSGFGNPSPPVASVTRLKENWYLVRYAGD